MTDNEKLLWDIESELEIFQAHVKRLRKNSGNLHELDAELLREKTRKLYDKLICFNQTSVDKSTTEVTSELKEEKLGEPDVISGDALFEEKEETKQIEKGVIAEKVIADQEAEIEAREGLLGFEIEQKSDEPETSEVSIEEPIMDIPEKQPEQNTAEKIEVVQPIPDAANHQKESDQINEKQHVVRSNIDLFSDTVEETIADKFGNASDSSIANKMQQSQIEDLRQAIGINEKFLFINGLFNGDLGRYNKAIDEFNELTTKEGVNAHFLELKIHNQWSDDNDGAVKLKALLDRKFS